MKILALDTATEIGGVALLEGEVLRGQVQIRVHKTHANQLWKVIFFLLEQTEWTLPDIDLWAVTIGPGSFTGLRIGIATIKGLALATQKPIVGISTLEALAFSFSHSPHLICPTMDARKKEVFCAYFRADPQGKINPVGEPRNIKPQALAKEIKEPVLLVGNGARLYQDLFKESLGPLALIPEPHLHLISPMIIGLLAGHRFHQGLRASLEEIRPLYLRPSDAEGAKKI
ncbi:MAG: tRNA (adenosine(37)-N6)-threonylcarbamoyltransferase complex dimerization subunit type 1 TsaB [Desulfobacca sp.]|nr:tRNA (adenosine(37)-N6)-threonylcarbamoyltransferase complex dimerization subunit type 1 TsaB [Desulfobacca sp.]